MFPDQFFLLITKKYVFDHIWSNKVKNVKFKNDVINLFH